MTIPYTYLIHCKPINMYYYGVRYAKGCCPSDLFKQYFTSSKKVKKLIEIYGLENFETEIRKEFKTKKLAIEWEHRVLNRISACRHPKFLNMTDNKSLPLLIGDVNPSKRPEIRKLLSEQKKKDNPMFNIVSKNKMKNTIIEQYKNGREPWNKGKANCFNEVTLKKMSKNRTGKEPWNKGKANCFNEVTLKKMSLAKQGISTGPKSNLTKSKISQKRIGKKWFKNIITNECVCCFPNNVPIGFIPGMIKMKEKNV